jgi:hypothetical protein
VADEARGGHEESTGRRLQQKDRTPSFYTSRSIINLSGLSVADPMPVSDVRSTNSTSSLPRGLSSNSVDDMFFGDAPMIDDEYGSRKSPSPSAHRTSPRAEVDRAPSESDGFDPLVVSVETADIPLSSTGETYLEAGRATEGAGGAHHSGAMEPSTDPSGPEVDSEINK